MDEARQTTTQESSYKVAGIDVHKNYKVAGIDVHKNMLAVVVTDAAEVGEYRFERRKFGAAPSELSKLAEWLMAHGIKEAVMESTAQYWKPVWQALEGKCELHLAQAHSNRAPKGRKRDFADAERLVKRYIAGELILSFVPDPQQRLWRMMTRTKHQLTGHRRRRGVHLILDKTDHAAALLVNHQRYKLMVRWRIP